MKKTLAFALTMFGFLASEEIPFTNVVFHNETREQTSYICDSTNKSGEDFISGTTGATFLPSYFSLKTGVFFTDIPNTPYNGCVKYVYTSNTLRPEHVLLDSYQTYKSLQSQYLDQKALSDTTQAELTQEEINFNDLKAIREAKETELQKLNADIYRTEDSNLVKSNTESSLSYEYESLQAKSANNAAILLEYETVKTEIGSLIEALDAKKIELADAQSKYVISGTDNIVDGMLTDSGMTSSAEYNVADYLENYIKAHQSDIRTNKQTDFTVIDLDYMKLQFLETKGVR